MTTRGITDYSETIKGVKRNHYFDVAFDVTDGFVGITQYQGRERFRDGSRVVSDRVLLSPAQWRALVAFMAQRHSRRAR